MDVRQSKFWQVYLEKLGWKKFSIGKNSAYVRKIPFGAIVKIPRVDQTIGFKEIDDLAVAEKAFLVKMEPNIVSEDKKFIQTLLANGYTGDNWSLQPTKTIQVDLEVSEETLLKNMEKDTRYSVHRSERESVVVEKSEDIDVFLKLHKETSKRQNFWVSTEDSKSLWNSLPKENRSILFAKKGPEVLAGAFLIFYDSIAYYYEAGSTKKGRRLLAPYVVVWESLKLAKEKNCKRFDFEGVVDPRIKATKKWEGFTHFKKGFGGNEVMYLGSFVKYYNPIVKLVFSLNKFF